MDTGVLEDGGKRRTGRLVLHAFLQFGLQHIWTGKLEKADPSNHSKLPINEDGENNC